MGFIVQIPCPGFDNLFVGDHLFDTKTNYYYGDTTIVSMTNDTLTLDKPAFNSSIKGHTLVIAALQLADSDLFNSAFESIWNTPRTMVGGVLVSDITAMRDAGFNMIRLYNWDPYRSTTNPAGNTNGNLLPDDQHIPFLNDVYYGNLAGTPGGLPAMKVLVPVSNYFLADAEWNGSPGAPDANNYALTSAPPQIQNDLEAFIKSVVVGGTLDAQGNVHGGKLDAGVYGFEIGNEIDLYGAGFAHNDLALATQRALWWVVNLQSQLQKGGYLSTSPGIKFTIPVSNADEANAPNSVPKTDQPTTSWFEVFQSGASMGDLQPHGGQDWGTKFPSNVLGLDKVSSFPYNKFFFNSYQVFQIGDQLSNLLGKYNNQQTHKGDWMASWPGTQFTVPLVLTELGFNRLTAGSEQSQFDTVVNQQATVAQTFLASAANKHFNGYVIFEWNDEPNKNNLTGPVDTEQVFGIFKYYPARNSLKDWRARNPVGDPYYTGTGDANTPPNTYLPGSQYPVAPLQYTVYELYPVTSDAGVSIIDALKKVFAMRG